MMAMARTARRNLLPALELAQGRKYTRHSHFTRSPVYAVLAITRASATAARPLPHAALTTTALHATRAQTTRVQFALASIVRCALQRQTPPALATRSTLRARGENRKRSTKPSTSLCQFLGQPTVWLQELARCLQCNSRYTSQTIKVATHALEFAMVSCFVQSSRLRSTSRVTPPDASVAIREQMSRPHSPLQADPRDSKVRSETASVHSARIPLRRLSVVLSLVPPTHPTHRPRTSKGMPET